MKRISYHPRNLAFGLCLILLGMGFVQHARAQHAPAVHAPLDARGIDNLVAFTKLYGYVRYFHPTDQALATNWEYLALEGTEAVHDAADAEDLADRLRVIFAPIAPTVQIFPTDAPPSEVPSMLPEGDLAALRIARWEHNGVGMSANSIYQSSRSISPAPGGQPPAGFDDPRVPYEADLGGGVSARIPLTLFYDGQTIPRPQEVNPWQGDLPSSGSLQPGEQWGSITIAWNIFQHFYPYFDVVETDWPDVLRQAFAKNEEGHWTALRYLVAQLHDGHGSVFGSNDFYDRFPNAPQPFFYLPLAWEWVEESLVVTASGSGSVARGDVITHIDGQPMAAVLAEEEALISGATPQWKRYIALIFLLRGPLNARRTLTVETPDGQTSEVTLAHTLTFNTQVEEEELPVFTELETGFFYVDLDRITTAEFNQQLFSLNQADGIVFDMRGYPGDINVVEKLSHFTDAVITSAQWHVPYITRPDQDGMTFTFSNWSIQPRSPRLTSNIVYITDGRAISYAETWMGMVEHYRLAEIVGQPTAGTNGNINPFTVPSGYRFNWTGMKVLKHDGSQHHGVGILPTVPAQRTLEGVRLGRDELLERAVAVISGIDAISVPETVELAQNYPNPFTTATRINFSLPEGAEVRIDVFNVLGKRVAELVKGVMEAGKHRVDWQPEGLPSGVYFYRLKANGASKTGTMTLVR